MRFRTIYINAGNGDNFVPYFENFVKYDGAGSTSVKF